jgi:sulfoquinovose isomerase
VVNSAPVGLKNLPWRGADPGQLAQELLEFAAPAAVEHGFGWLGSDGALLPENGVELWITGRMTHVFAQATSWFGDRWRPGAEHGVTQLLTGRLRDPHVGGWFSRVGEPTRKAAYDHTFVILAGGSAMQAGIARGEELLAAALATWDEYFWDGAHKCINESFAADWSDLEPYRGANAHMHGVEAMLAAASATGDAGRVQQALAVTSRLIDGVARAHKFRLPEHFSLSWQPELDYNINQPHHPFRPYGVTIGHLLEWSRLCVEVHSRCPAGAADWLLPAAVELYERALADGWALDGAGGFIYTTDFAGNPVATNRLHWVVTEAIAAAAALHVVTGEQRFAQDWLRFTHHAADHFIDGTLSWHAELDETLTPAPKTWPGKPDIYHAWGAVLARPA